MKALRDGAAGRKGVNALGDGAEGQVGVKALGVAKWAGKV